VPFNINRFSIDNGEVHYRDFTSTPKVDVFVQDIYAEARNLTNSEDRTGSLVATFDGRARAMKSGRIRFDGKVDPYAKQPKFESDFKLDGLDIRELNPYLRAYANVDAEQGTFAMDAELAARDGRFNGYVKPFVKDLDVLRWKEERASPTASGKASSTRRPPSWRIRSRIRRRAASPWADASSPLKSACGRHSAVC
jgi:hypothetical protein